MMNYEKSLPCILVMIAIVGVAQGQDNEPELPSHLPGPPEDPPETSGNEGGGNENGNPESSNEVQQNGPFGPPLTDPTPASPPVAFGFNHIVLIMVPQLKFKLQHSLATFFGSNCKLSLPITVFFEKLKAHPPLPPPPYPDSPYYGPFFPGGHYVRKRSVRHLLQEQRSGGNRPLGPGHGQDLDDPRLTAERVTLIPKLGKLLGSLGLGGKECLLRTICEVHEFPLEDEGYGILGEMFSMFFSISRSAFAESHHLAEYLEAERAGKEGDCRRYEKECSSSLFYWEKLKGESSRTNNNGSNYVEEEIGTMLLEEVGLVM